MFGRKGTTRAGTIAVNDLASEDDAVDLVKLRIESIENARWTM